MTAPHAWDSAEERGQPQRQRISSRPQEPRGASAGVKIITSTPNCGHQDECEKRHWRIRRRQTVHIHHSRWVITDLSAFTVTSTALLFPTIALTQSPALGKKAPSWANRQPNGWSALFTDTTHAEFTWSMPVGPGLRCSFQVVESEWQISSPAAIQFTIISYTLKCHLRDHQPPSPRCPVIMMGGTPIPQKSTRPQFSAFDPSSITHPTF